MWYQTAIGVRRWHLWNNITVDCKSGYTEDVWNSVIIVWNAVMDACNEEGVWEKLEEIKQFATLDTIEFLQNNSTKTIFCLKCYRQVNAIGTKGYFEGGRSPLSTFKQVLVGVRNSLDNVCHRIFPVVMSHKDKIMHELRKQRLQILTGYPNNAFGPLKCKFT